MKNVVIACGFVLLGLAFYIFVFITITFLPELYASVVTDKDANTCNRLAALSNSDAVKNGLATLLSIIQTIVVYILTQKDKPFLKGPAVPESIKLDNPTPYNLVGQKNYTDRVLEQFKELKDDNVKKEAKIKRMGEKLYVLKVFARQKTLICMLSSVALCFAISHIFAAGAQAYFRTYPLSTEPWAFLQYFTQSILLSLFAMCIAYCYYRRYLYLVRTTDFKSVFAIGWGGIFVAGLLTMIQTPPEVYALLLMNNVKDVSYLNWPVIPFLLISKLGVFPFMGLFGAAIAGVSKIPEIKKA